MQNLWQQAEQNTGALIEAERLSERLRDTLISAPGDKMPEPSTPVRAGILGALDAQAGSIARIVDILASMLEYVGERGTASIGGSVREAEMLKAAMPQRGGSAKAAPNPW